jgi:hypothetical protein
MNGKINFELSHLRRRKTESVPGLEIGLLV